jgi:hypothetical protein
MGVDTNGTWNAAGDDWTGSTHHFGPRGFASSDGLSSVDECAVFAVGDTDNVAIHTRVLDNNLSSHFTYLGEITPNYTSGEDPNPVIILDGDNRAADLEACLGYGLNAGNTIYNGGRGLNASNDGELTYYLPFFHVVATSSVHVLQGYQRIHSAKTGRIYTQDLSVECRTASNWERRGKLKKVYIANQDIPRGYVFGDNSEFLHTFAGIVIDWNTSGVHELRL